MVGLVVPAPISAFRFVLSLIAFMTGPSPLFGATDALEFAEDRCFDVFGEGLASCVGKRTALRAFSVCGPVGRYLGSRRPI